jgi:hypothetical protein
VKGEPVHDTDARYVSEPPLGRGGFWIVHVLPFQRSASITDEPVFADPTAVQAVAEVHETELNSGPA